MSTSQDDDVAVVLPGRIRKRLLSAIGVHATHALEDGLVLGVLFALTYASPEILTIITLALFGSAIRQPKRLLARADELVRRNHIQAQPAYFIVAFAAAALATSVAGVLLRGPAALPVDPVVVADVVSLLG